ncbi:TRAFAC clade GTPase domain-containing protein [Streptomyces cucumeris]|uniref:TRAFAC clade GTPase domain-containing protein n=1 Tax=Streptomyces cucumeris TaxID=2962890 RepID=UPI003EBB0DA3
MRFGGGGRGRRTWVCPHCFRRVGRGGFGFVCVTGGRECAEDRRLAAADPLDRRATCGTCGHLTTRRRCHACGDRLPEGYLESPGRIVALAGPVSSGKSTYIAVLVHELLHRLGDELGTSLVPCDDRTTDDYRERYERHLYDSHRTVPKTQERDGGRPLVYRLGRTRRGAFGRTRDTSLTLVFLDTAGEHFGSRDRMETRLRYLAEADAVVVLIDPGDVAGPGAASNPASGAAAGGAVRTAEHTAGPSADVLTRVLRHLGEVHAPGGRRKVPVPVGVALTKLDLLWPRLPDNSPLHRTRTPGPVFDADDRAAVHTELRALLTGWQEGGLARRLDQSCADYQLFAVSMLGSSPRGAELGLGGVRPHRVEDPLMWLLHRFGMLDRGTG